MGLYHLKAIPIEPEEGEEGEAVEDTRLFEFKNSPVFSPEYDGWVGLTLTGTEVVIKDPARELEVIEIEPTKIYYPDIVPAVFYTCFTPQERIDIKASTDHVVQEFYASFLMAYNGNIMINPNVPSTIGGLYYLSITNVEGAEPPRKYLAEGRMLQIRQGLVQ